MTAEEVIAAGLVYEGPPSDERLKEALSELQMCAVSWEPGARLLGNVTALEIECLMNQLAKAQEVIHELNGALDWLSQPVQTTEGYYALGSWPTYSDRATNTNNWFCRRAWVILRGLKPRG